MNPIATVLRRFLDWSTALRLDLTNWPGAAAACTMPMLVYAVLLPSTNRPEHGLRPSSTVDSHLVCWQGDVTGATAGQACRRLRAGRAHLEAWFARLCFSSALELGIDVHSGVFRVALLLSLLRAFVSKLSCVQPAISTLSEIANDRCVHADGCLHPPGGTLLLKLVCE